MKATLAFLEKQQARFDNQELDAAAIVGPEGDLRQQPAWTPPIRALFNLDEAIVR